MHWPVMFEGHVAAWVDTRHGHKTTSFPSRRGVPRGAQGLPKGSWTGLWAAPEAAASFGVI